ncbi:MAG: 5-formyltetrahydrofolate cyclo-ligase [Spirochaetes bacterium GWC1_27_15]|nr:MAG: 5-formyltetrahydrofolate cyclo-ligase [Spirochaetes bacterium GWC1_27_15]
MQKEEIRKIFKQKRELIDDKTLLDKSKKLSDIIIQTEEYKKSQTIFCYVSFDKEVDTNYFLQKCLSDKKNLCVPLVIGKNMIASKIDSLNSLIKNRFGILEPTVKNEISKDNIDLVIVPGLAFTISGQRIGYGAGFYDKYLSDYKGITFGIVFSDFIINECDFTPQSFDIPVKKVLFI